MSLTTKRAILTLVNKYLRITFILFVYLLIGATLFYNIEYDHETAIRNQLKELYNQLTELSDVKKGSYIKVDLVRQIVEYNLYAQRHGIHQWNETSNYWRWNFLGSFYFSLIVVSTIGYGNQAPSSHLGKAVCVIYALIGIPLFLNILSMFMSDVALLITNLRNRLPGQFKHHCLLVMAVVLSINFVTFILLPAFIISNQESWSLSQSLYYSFITLSTIGFGDFVAGNNSDASLHYKIFLIIWMVLGLGYVSALITFGRIILEKICHKVHQVGDQNNE